MGIQRVGLYVATGIKAAAILRELICAVDRIRQRRIIAQHWSRSWNVNRLVSLVMLVAFAAQHLMCCCTGAAAHCCDHDHPATGRVCTIADSHDDHGSHECGHESHECKHEHLSSSDCNHSDHESCPGDPTHQHHYCVGTHVFFMSAPRVDMPPSAMDHDFGFGSLDVSIQGVMTSLAAASRHGVDSGPPLSSCPQRSALCVYRI